MIRPILFYSWLLCICITQVQAQVAVADLRCESRVEPMGIDDLMPRLSWQLRSTQRNIRQTSYRVLVASSRAKLDRNAADIWDSGEVDTQQSVQNPFTGDVALQSGQRYFWKVRVTTNKGVSPWSKPATWTMGLLRPEDWGAAKWIGYDKPSVWDSISQWSRLSARYLRKEFESRSAIKRATLNISGLGLYELYVNGHKIGDEVLSPNPTDYRKSVLYNTHDVTNHLRNGANAIGVILGNGRFFTMRQNYKTHKHNTFGYPKLLFRLNIEYADGAKQVIVSDGSWKINVDGPIRTNNEYDGEEYDARKEFGPWTKPGFVDAAWMPASIVQAPAGIMRAQPSEPMRVMRRIKPISIKPISDGRWIIDMGQNFAGWITMKNIRGKRGDRITLRFAESLKADGALFTANLRDAKVTDVYTLKGGAVEQWHPVFVYHGFRYVEVSGYPGGRPKLDDFEGALVYDDIETTGQFRTSNATLNAVYRNAWWGIASNYKGMPVDCPQRNERQPWLGDRTIGAQGESYMFANGNLYAKWMDDIAESQTEAGSIPDVAPAFWNYYSDDVTWPAAFITISNHLYNQFGDSRTFRKHYPAMRKWMLYMRSKYMKGGIMTRDKYGDWCVPPETLTLIHAKDSTRKTDGQLIATAYYYKLLSYMQRFATMSGLPDHASEYGRMSDTIRSAFQSKFFDAKRVQYDNGTVTANLLPLYFGICPDSLRAVVFEKIRQKIHVEAHGHITTGLIGSQWLMRGLTEYGYADLAWILATNDTYPSWGYMAANGATTIWELWNGNTADPGMNSQNHVMLLGDLITWCYENIAGIRSDKSKVAFQRIIMKPVLPAGLDSVDASFRSPHGLIRSHWKNQPDRFEWTITIPANATAEVHIPSADSSEIFIDGNGIGYTNDVRWLRHEKGAVVLEVPSGRWKIERRKGFKRGIVREEFIFDRASFPESHAATIAETPQGLIAAWFGGTKEGTKDVCIWTSRLEQGKWTAPEMVADGRLNDSVRHACYNPVLFQMPDKGPLLLFYKIGPNVAGWTGWMKRSLDHGRTWSEREALPEGFLGPIKNKPVLIGKRLLCPSSTEKSGWKVHIETTTDMGRTWTKTSAINDGKLVSAIQPSILQHADGRLQLLCRSKERVIRESWSSDGGLTWSEMKAASLPNNNSGTDAVTLTDGRHLLVYNHVKPAPELTNGKGPRTPLNVAVSKDGKQWDAALVLEDSPLSQYSYPSVIQSKDGLVHIVYTWRREKIKYVCVDPSKLNGQSIHAGEWPQVRR
jgi:alpha-L-rhamnosidase